jgi:hypothetical protein
LEVFDKISGFIGVLSGFIAIHLSRGFGLQDGMAGFSGGFEDQLAMPFVHGVGIGTGPGLGAYAKAVGLRPSGDAQEGH